jgi:hypothetical protein
VKSNPLAFFLLVPVVVGAQTFIGSFEAGTPGWEAPARTIALTRVPGLPDGSRGGLLAMAWVLSGERQYLGAAREWALASCGYPTWGLGRIDGMDLAAGHQLYGLGLVYKWCPQGHVENPDAAGRLAVVQP